MENKSQVVLKRCINEISRNASRTNNVYKSDRKTFPLNQVINHVQSGEDQIKEYNLTFWS